MKRFTAVFLCALLLLSFPVCRPAAGAAAPGKYKINSDATPVYAEPDLLSDKLGEVYKGTFVTVTDIAYGFGQVFIYSTGISGWIQLNAMRWAEDEPQPCDIVGLTVTKPLKTVYTESEEELDLYGLRVFALHADGSEEEVSGYSVFTDSIASYGKKKVRITYTPDGTDRIFETDFDIEILKVPLTGLSVVTPPGKTLYLEHDVLDLTGLTVKASYADGRADRLFTLDEILTDPDMSFSGCHDETQNEKLEKGSHTFTLTYKYPDIRTSFDIDVTPRKLEMLVIRQFPDSEVAYSKTAKPDIKGLMLEASYDNGEVEDVPYTECEVVCDPSQFVLGEGNRVDVYFDGMSVTLYYRLALNEVIGIRVIPPKQLSFIMGHPIDLSSTRVELVYADGTLENIEDFYMTPLDPTRTGSQNIIVTYGGYSDVFSVFITPYYRKGDVDGNGKVEAADARLTLRATVGFVTLTGLAYTAADCDNDGNITPADARTILRAAVGLENLQ